MSILTQPSQPIEMLNVPAYDLPFDAGQPEFLALLRESGPEYESGVGESEQSK
jgi:hypothetical protein